MLFCYRVVLEKIHTPSMEEISAIFLPGTRGMSAGREGYSQLSPWEGHGCFLEKFTVSSVAPYILYIFTVPGHLLNLFGCISVVPPSHPAVYL